MLTDPDRHGSPAIKDTKPSGAGDEATSTAKRLLGF